MASRLAQLATAARAIQPTPFRSGGSPQLADALDAIVTRSVGVAPKATDSVLDERAKSLSPSEEAAVDSALKSLQSMNSAAALKEHDPHYYDRMREGVHRSAQGIARSWWKRFFQVRGQA